MIKDTVVLPASPSSEPTIVQSAITPDGNFFYLPYGNVYVLRTSDNKIIDSITVGSDPYLVTIAPNGQYAYALNASDGTVSVINIQPQGRK